MLRGRRASNLTRAALPASHWKAPDVSTADFFSGAKNSQCSLSEGRFSLMPVTSEQLPYILPTSAAPMMSQDGQTVVVKYALEGGKNVNIALDAQTSNELLRSLAELLSASFNNQTATGGAGFVRMISVSRASAKPTDEAGRVALCLIDELGAAQKQTSVIRSDKDIQAEFPAGV
jgi:hypothetical protein